MKSILLLIIIITFPFDSQSQWTQITTAPVHHISNILDVNGVIYLSYSSLGVYKSSDGTLTWLQINNGLNNNQSRQVYEIAYFNGNLFAATVDGIYKSTNGGEEWIKKSSGITLGPGAVYEFCESVFVYN